MHRGSERVEADRAYVAADESRDARDREAAAEERFAEAPTDHALRLAYAWSALATSEARLATAIAAGWDALPYWRETMARKRRDVVRAVETVNRLVAIVAAGERRRAA